MPNLNIITFDKIYEEYLRDESRKIGNAVSISFPTTEEEVIEILSHMKQNKTSVTIQGARTGITAGAVPNEGHVLNLTKMDRVTGMVFDKERGCFIIKVQPGVILQNLRNMLLKKEFDSDNWTYESQKALELFKKSGEWFFPPDPTEASASIGGMTACNSSGACSFLYGPVRNYIEALDIILSNGSKLRLRKGNNKTNGRNFEITDDSGNLINGVIPLYNFPNVKNASGYFSADEIDLIDLFIGSEGTLGVVTGIELRLVPAPACIWGMMAFFTSEESALQFVKKVRGDGMPKPYEEGLPRPAAIELFNSDTLNLLRKMKKENPAFSELSDIPDKFHTAIYVECHGENEDDVCNTVMNITEILEMLGGDGNDTWLAANPKEMERLHVFRHAVPEAVNLIIDTRRKNNPSLTKLGTDMAVPNDKLVEVINIYNRDLAESGLESVIFGHIGNNHVHVNILPASMDEYDKGKKLYLNWARKVVEMGGTVSAEHGIGKLKKAMLEEMYGADGIKQMRDLKIIFDPDNILNVGNLFD